jgi:hypothetical protein
MLFAQRPILSFENFIMNYNDSLLEFEIHQKNNPEILKCKFPHLQKVIGASGEKDIAISLNTIKSSQEKVVDDEHDKIHGFSLVEYPNNYVEKHKFLVWFSPEKFLQNYWSNIIECDIEGDIRSFLKYKIHYVGKATKQSVFERLTGHKTLQEILSLELPFKYGDLPTHEISILLFEFRDNIEMTTWGEDSDINEMVAVLSGEKYTDRDKIFLDAEKALIKAMKPKYNKELFNNYPVSTDGLYNENFDAISYTIMDPITLVYESGEIIGGITPHLGGDAIIILNNNEFKLEKYRE